MATTLAAVKVNTTGMRDLLKSEEVARMLEERMAAALDTAEANAPVDSGAYRASLRVVREVYDNRVAVLLVAEVAYALYVEADTGNLARALDSVFGA